jgi:hypothetical protein
MLSSLFVTTMLFGTAADSGVPVCMVLDQAVDQLSEEERRTALGLFGQAVALWGRTLAPDACANPWLLSHVKVGTQLSVALSGAGTAHLRRADGYEALLGTYLELLRAREAPDTPVNAVALATQPPAPQPSTTKPRSWFGSNKGKGHFYARFGYSGTIRKELKLGPCLGIGYRVEYGRTIIDLSTANLSFWRQTSAQDYQSTWDAYMRLMVFRYLDDILDLDFYAGGGLGIGRTDSHDYFKADGYKAELGAGYEILRNAFVRTFVQVVTSLPIYQVFANDYYYYGVRQPDYAFSVAASIGVGF